MMMMMMMMSLNNKKVAKVGVAPPNNLGSSTGKENRVISSRKRAEWLWTHPSSHSMVNRRYFRGGKAGRE